MKQNKKQNPPATTGPNRQNTESALLRCKPHGDTTNKQKTHKQTINEKQTHKQTIFETNQKQKVKLSCHHWVKQSKYSCLSILLRCKKLTNNIQHKRLLSPLQCTGLSSKNTVLFVSQAGSRPIGPRSPTVQGPIRQESVVIELYRMGSWQIGPRTVGPNCPDPTVRGPICAEPSGAH